MKKHVLAFGLVVFLFTQTKGQTSVYHAFPDSDASWCCATGFCETPSCGYSLSKYLLNGNVQIDSLTYNRLVHYSLSLTGGCEYEGCMCCDVADSSIDTTTYYYRQDIGLKKVWLYDPATQRDTILYNFDLHIGDTLDGSKVNWYNQGFGLYIITSIDSILINGLYRTRYNFSLPKACWLTSSLDTSSLIEGIGSLSGLMYEPGCFEYGASLTEFVQNNNLIYGDTTYNRFEPNCPDFPMSVNNEAVNESSILIYPNPAGNQLTIQTSALHGNEGVRVLIRNVLGQETSPPAPLQRRGGNATIDVSGLSAGVYFVEVTTSEGRWVGRFVKE